MTLKNRRCLIGIKGQEENPELPIDIWFSSLKSVASVLSKENRDLLKTIDLYKPQSLTELASLSGRALSNISRTLKTLEAYGLVTLTSSTKTINVQSNHKEFLIVINNEK